MATGKKGTLTSLLVLHEELDRVIHDVVAGVRRRGSERRWRPAADVFVSRSAVVVRLELAGVRREDITDLSYHEGELIVRGTRRETEGEPKEGYWQMEIPHGPFERAVKIPGRVDADRIEAVCRDGILEIRMPKLGGRSSTRIVRIKGSQDKDA